MVHNISTGAGRAAAWREWCDGVSEGKDFMAHRSIRVERIGYGGKGTNSAMAWERMQKSDGLSLASASKVQVCQSASAMRDLLELRRVC